MNPFFFGTRERRLFGIYTPAQRGGTVERGVVLCHPWGQEYLRAHRSMRHLGALLTKAGVHVLRFDYFGTGDSGGDMQDGDLEGWRSDIETAIDELRDTTGVERVDLVGLRLGATLAADVAARRRADVGRLVMWDPVVDGEEYVRELQEQAASEGPPPVPGRPLEVFGFVLPERLGRELRAIRLGPMVPSLPERTEVVLSAPLPSHAGLRAQLGAAGRRVHDVPSPPAWLEERSTGVGALPVPVLQRIVEVWG